MQRYFYRPVCPMIHFYLCNIQNSVSRRTLRLDSYWCDSLENRIKWKLTSWTFLTQKLVHTKYPQHISITWRSYLLWQYCLKCTYRNESQEKTQSNTTPWLIWDLVCHGPSYAAELGGILLKIKGKTAALASLKAGCYPAVRFRRSLGL